ncbi:MAG: M24 family metallopeptidase, partial [Acidobacteriaceae bacterium]|nr:M24 family metallopeptidase [Acidobacteriaceae bacterium]
MNIETIQDAILASGLDGWLFFDHHRRDPLAYRILGIPGHVTATRRWYYFIPAKGAPRKLVHRIESQILDALPGSKQAYSSWQEQHTRLKDMLSGCSRIAMQYSPNCAIPYVSLVDAGTVELVRSLGVEIVSSANMVQEFEARLSEKQFAAHIEAGRRVDRARREAFEFIGQRIRSGERINDYDVKQFILKQFEQNGLTTDHGPIVAVNEHASDPHYEPTSDAASPIRRGDFVLIDMW